MRVGVVKQDTVGTNGGEGGWGGGGGLGLEREGDMCMEGNCTFLTIYIYFITFFLGTVFGSFINCMSWRIVNGENVLKGRSHCTACNHVLGVRDLFPVLSYLFLKGKCRCFSQIGRAHV